MQTDKTILAIVGMPGAGKSEATSYLQKKGFPFIRFGQLTDEGVAEMGLPLTPDNERLFREKIREELGMAAYAIKAKPKIVSMLEQSNDVIVIDGLRSWEEFLLLKDAFPQLSVVHIYAEPVVRYARLLKREVRSAPVEKSRERDIAELEKLNMGGAIALADHLIENDSEEIEDLHQKIDLLLTRLHIGGQ